MLPSRAGSHEVVSARKPRTGRVAREDLAYVALACGLGILMASHTLNEQWASPDFFVHLAAVREFASDLFGPGHPIVTGTDPDPYLSPYTMAVGAVVNITGISGVSALSLMALVNLALLVVAMRQFVRVVSARPWAPFWTLVFTLLAWGWSPWRWSGFLNLNSMGFGLPYPSAFATAMALFTLAAVSRWIDRGRRLDLAVAALLAAVVLLSHPVTAGWAALVGVAIVVAHPRATSRRRLGLLALAVGFAAALCLLWPYYPLLDLAGSTDTYAVAHEVLYELVGPRTFLAIPGLVVVVLRARRSPRDVLVLGALLTGGAYAIGAVTGESMLGRVLPGLMLMLHVALADWTAATLESSTARNRRIAAGTMVAAIVLVGAAGATSGLVRAIPRSLLPASRADDARLASLVDPYEPLSELIGHDDVFVSTKQHTLGVAALSGKTIAPPDFAAPLVTDVDTRIADQRVVLEASDRSAWTSAVERNDVSFVVLPSDQDPGRIVAMAESAGWGAEVLRAGDALQVIALDRG